MQNLPEPAPPAHDRRGFLKASAGLALAAALSPPALAGLVQPDARGPSARLPGFSMQRGLALSISNNTGGNSLMLPAGDRVLVVDAKFSYVADALRADAVSTLPEGERADAGVVLVNTHHHADHTAGNVAFVGRGESYAHANAIERISDSHANYVRSPLGGPGQVRRVMPDRVDLFEAAAEIASRARTLEPEAWVPTSAVDEQKTLVLGMQSVELVHFGPGHTDNDLVVRIPAANVLHTGDLVFRGFHPFCDPEGGVSPTKWIKVLKKVRALCDNDTLVVPGHGEPGEPAIIDEQRAYFEQLFEVVGAEIDKGTPRGEIRQMSWPFMEGLGFEQIRSRAIEAVHDEIKPPAQPSLDDLPEGARRPEGD